MLGTFFYLSADWSDLTINPFVLVLFFVLLHNSNRMSELK